MLLRRLFGGPRADAAQQISVDELAAAIGAMSMTKAGVSVSVSAALQVATVYACVDRVSAGVKSIPLKVFERAADGSHTPVDHQLNYLLNERASEWWSSSDAWAYLVYSKLLYGDAYALLHRKSYRSSELASWEPVNPTRVSIVEDDSGNKAYKITSNGKPPIMVPPEDMVHLTSLGFDGEKSPSPITAAGREVVGASIASQNWQSQFFKEGATFDYALTTDARMTADQLKNLAQQVQARASGSRFPLMLAGGVKPAQLTINPRDAEILDQRKFSVEEICRIFGVPPHMIGHTEKSTSWQAGLEAMGTAFVRYTLMPHLVQIAQAFNHRLWPSRNKYFVEHVTAALERGDLKSRNEAYRVALGRAGEPGWMTVNEVRRKENLPPIDGGDELFKPEETKPEAPLNPQEPTDG
jgi:HK97 family phage portal protein